MKYLITNADDFGYRPDISRGIIQAHTLGVLKSTTVLVNFISQEEITALRSVPNLGLGLHLNLTSGEPLTKNWKEKYGSFSRPQRNQPQQFDRNLWISHFERFSTEDVLIEYQAQLHRFMELFGQVPTHLDTHHYTSVYEGVFPAYVQLAKENNLPVRLPVIWQTGDKQHPMGDVVASELHSYRVVTELGLKSASYFSTKYLNRFDNWLEILGEELSQIDDKQVLELSFHPGFEEDWRKKDLDILINTQTRDLLKKMQVELITYAQLP